MASLLYSSGAMEDLGIEQGNIVQVTTSTEHLSPLANPINDIEHMFSKIVFYPDGEEPIEFHSHECVRIAHCLIEGMRVQKKDLIKPLVDLCPKVPCYSSYNDQVENEFQNLLTTFFLKLQNFIKLTRKDSDLL